MTMRLATASWADPAAVDQHYLYRDGSIWIGRSQAGAAIGYDDKRHVCLVSGTRGGKGTTSIVNSLLVWPGSVVVLDPKGENATITAARRGKGAEFIVGLGQAVHILDPFDAARVSLSRSRFNPLDALDPHSRTCIDDAIRIADAVVIVRESDDPFWDESAREMVKALLLHVLTADEYEGERNLLTVRRLLTRGYGDDPELAQGALWQGVSRNPAFRGKLAAMGETFISLYLGNRKGYESVLQVAKRNTEFLDSDGMEDTLSTSDFKLSDLKTAEQGVSLYLCLPQRYMNTHHRWLRMMIALIVNEMEIVRGNPATGHQVLMVLDEFAGLKRMEAIETAVAQTAGHGLKMFFVLQSLEQLKAVYKDNWETFLTNASLKLFFNVEDHFSREYVSKLIGETEVIRDLRSESDSTQESESESRGVSRSRSESTGRSTSQGRSISEGTNWSESDSRSEGTTQSRGSSLGTSQGSSYTPWLFGIQVHSGSNNSSSYSYSDSHGTSEGWSHSVSAGGSRGSSLSSSEGFSETTGVSAGENLSTTKGTSFSRTSGQSETLHRRPLIAPDEIGRVFASVTDEQHPAYPGLALALVSGQPPMALRRVNYYEDDYFLGLFAQHPDHRDAFPPWTYNILEQMQSRMKPGVPHLKLRAAVKSGTLIEVGDTIASAFSEGERVATITFPVAGRVFRRDREFFILYRPRVLVGLPEYCPFKELDRYLKQIEQSAAEKRRQSEKLVSGLLRKPQDNLLLPIPKDPLAGLLNPSSPPVNQFTKQVAPPTVSPPMKVSLPKRQGVFHRIVNKVLDLL